MCRLKSAIILKDKIYMGEVDSHTELLRQLKIEDNRKNAESLFVRAELSPTIGDAFSDIDTWKFKVDQDIVPDWFVEPYEKERMVASVKEWAKTHIYVGADGLKLNSGGGYYIKDCKDVEICGNATVKYIYGNATVERICDDATVERICDDATVENISDDATVKYIYGNATVEYIGGNATVKYICGNATVKYICGNATVKYIYGNATVERICDDATVERICDDATVECICGNATVTTPCWVDWNNKKALIISENATFKDCFSKTIYQSGDWKFIAVSKEDK